MLNVSVFGLGYVGTVTAASLARDGHHVIGVDVDPEKVEAINHGRSPVAEPGLDELVERGRQLERLRATTSAREAVNETSVALVCVGTPTGADGRPDLRALRRVGEEIGVALRGRRPIFTVVLRSTVPPGTTQGELAGALELSGVDRSRIRVASNPEFMREGSALRDFVTPPFTLIGCAEPETAALLRQVYSRVDAPVVETSIPVSEMVKYACNAFHAVKICFANELAALCGGMSVDPVEVMRIFRLDRKLNLSELYLRPGFAFGGSCLPKDVRALVHAARTMGVEAPLLGSILPSNQLHLHRGTKAVLATGRRKVGVLGLAFKAGSDDVRESPLVTLVEQLLEERLDVRIFDRCLSGAPLVGANLTYLQGHLPELPALLCRDVAELAEHSEVLVLGHAGEDADEALRLVSADCRVVDLRSGQPGATDVRRPQKSHTPWRRLGAGMGALAMMVAAPAARAASDVPELPRLSVQIPRPTPGGRTQKVPRGGDLQTALLTARPGDTLVLAAGATYEGPFLLPPKEGSGWVTIRGTVDAAPPGRRVDPSLARTMPKLQSADDAVITAAPGAHHYYFVGVEIRPAPRQRVTNLIVLGDASTPAAQVPHHIVFEGCYLHGDPDVGTRRGIALNAAHVAVVDSYLSDFKETAADSQAIAGWSGPGPFLIRNNYLEAAGENVMFGGADSPSADRIPSDIEIRGNHFSKPIAWKPDDPSYAGRTYSVKNLFELKDARRALIEGNLFENNWAGAQSGFAILFTVRNQDGGAPFSSVEDITFRGNVVRRSAAGVNLLGRDNAQGGRSGQTRRVLIRDNLFSEIGGKWGGSGTLFQLLEGTADVVIDHNTGLQTGNVITADGAPHRGFVFRDNLMPHNAYGITGSGAGIGRGALAAYFPGAVIRRNVLAGGRSDSYPPDNYFPPKLDGIVQPGGDLALRSPYRAAGTDGRDLGADPNAIRAALRAATTQP